MVLVAEREGAPLLAVVAGGIEEFCDSLFGFPISCVPLRINVKKKIQKPN